MLRDALVVDGHMDTPLRILDDGVDPGYRDGRVQADLPRMAEGGVDAAFLAAWIDPAYAPGRALARCLALLDTVRGVAERHPDRAGFATTAAEARRIAATGRIALLAGVENGQALEGDPANVARLAGAGARYLTLTWMNSNDLGDAAGDEPHHGGLTPLGREVVLELERHGMLVDLAHVAPSAFFDAIEVAAGPVVVSHACTEARGPHPRNVTDEQIRAVAGTGGLVGIAFMPAYLVPGDPDAADVEAIADHVERVVEASGIDHVALGSDFDGMPALPRGIGGVEDLPSVVDALAARGWDDDALAPLLGGNWMRVLAAAEAR